MQSIKSQPKNWRKVKLGEVATIKSGEFIPTHERKEKGNYPIYGSNGIIGFTEKYLFEEPIITVGRVGAFGEVYLTKPKSWVSDNALVVKNNRQSDLKFLYYYLKKTFNFNAIVTGSTQPLITQSALANSEVYFPPLAEQHRIASILSAFDERIELNNKINKILEEMAQAIFKEWFVNSEKLKVKNEKWRRGKLGEIMESRKEKIKKYEEWKGLKLLDIGRLPRKNLAVTDYGKGKEIKTSVFAFKKWDILFGAVRPYFHKVVIAPFDGITNSSVFIIHPKQEIFYSFLIAILFSDSTISYATQVASGTKMPVLKWEDLCEMPIIIPDVEILKNFDNKVRPLYEKIIQNVEENQKLSALRDLLLPKLMSGEMLVNSEKLIVKSEK